MVHGQDAVSSDRSPVLILPYPAELSADQSGIFNHGTKSRARAQFVSKIRQALAAGKMVLVKGCMKGNHVQFNEEEVRLWRGTLAQSVQWQGLNPKQVVVTATLIISF